MVFSNWIIFVVNQTIHILVKKKLAKGLLMQLLPEYIYI